MYKRRSKCNYCSQELSNKKVRTRQMIGRICRIISIFFYFHSVRTRKYIDWIVATDHRNEHQLHIRNLEEQLTSSKTYNFFKSMQRVTISDLNLFTYNPEQQQTMFMPDILPPTNTIIKLRSSIRDTTTTTRTTKTRREKWKTIRFIFIHDTYVYYAVVCHFTKWTFHIKMH